MHSSHFVPPTPDAALAGSNTHPRQLKKQGMYQPKRGRSMPFADFLSNQQFHLPWRDSRCSDLLSLTIMHGRGLFCFTGR